MPSRLSRAAFVDRAKDPRSYYAFLPSDGHEFEDAAPPHILHQELQHFLHADMATLAIDTLDTLIISLMNRQPLSPEMLRAVSEKASQAYAYLLRGEKSHRELRMRLQHLNFCAQDMLDADITLPTTNTDALPYLSAWDFLPLKTGTLWATSDEQNIRWETPEGGRAYSAGLPSQLDAMDAHRISIGSIFSIGCGIWSEGAITHIPHALPLVLCWHRQGADYAIDYRGGIHRIEGHAVHEPNCARMPVGQVSRCRRIGERLYLFDWTAPHRMVVVSLADFSSEEITLKEVMLGNDLVGHGNHFYLIDKQQGSVFKYDAEWRYQSRALAFGKGPGRLYDPITLRFHEGRLRVLNWLSNSLVSLPPF